MSKKQWRTIIVGYPIIAKLINGMSVKLETSHICLIPDDQLINEHQKITHERIVKILKLRKEKVSG